MKKLIIQCVAGLAIGVGMGTGVAWLRRPPAPEPVLVAAQDSADAAIGAGEVMGDASVDGHEPDREPVPLTGPGEATVAVSQRAAGSTETGAGPAASRTTPAAAGLPGAAAGDTSDVERMSQIFGTMKPQEAARVLERLEDRQVEVLLLGLSDRKAAAILASFPAERAASLTRSIMARNPR
jgi:hypothetical protein